MYENWVIWGIPPTCNLNTENYHGAVDLGVSFLQTDQCIYTYIHVSVYIIWHMNTYIRAPSPSSSLSDRTPISKSCYVKSPWVPVSEVTGRLCYLYSMLYYIIYYYTIYYYTILYVIILYHIVFYYDNIYMNIISYNITYIHNAMGFPFHFA